MAITISIINNKGGVGKTTSTAIMAELLACLGKKVLCIDLDQQSNLSMMLGCYEEDSSAVINGTAFPEKENVAELFKFRYRELADIKKLVRETHIPNLDMIPSSKRHKNTQRNINTNETGNNNIILKKALAVIKNEYDFILLDNAPASDVLTVNSIFASDYVLTPVRVEGFSYKGLKETLDTIAYIKDEHDIENANFLGVFITQAELNTNVYRGINETYASNFGTRFLTTPVRKDIKISEIETDFQPILKYSPNTNAVYDYSRLLLELGILDNEDRKKLMYAIGEIEEEALEMQKED